MAPSNPDPNRRRRQPTSEPSECDGETPKTSTGIPNPNPNPDVNPEHKSHRLKETWLKGSCAMMGDMHAEDGSFVPLQTEDGDEPESARSTEIHEMRYDSLGESFEVNDAGTGLGMQQIGAGNHGGVVDDFGLPVMGPSLAAQLSNSNSAAGIRISPRARQGLLRGSGEPPASP